MINWLRSWRHLLFCGGGRVWIPSGDDAVCSACGWRVSGGGPEARVSERVRLEDTRRVPPAPVDLAAWDAMSPEEQDALIASGWHPGPCLACKNAMEQGEQCQACGYIEPGQPPGAS